VDREPLTCVVVDTAAVSRTGSQILLEALADEGVRHVFGNPGTTELPLVDALADRDEPLYVLALQEATAVGMADGYARLTRRPSFVNLHTLAGLANGLGNLTNAAAAGTPIVVTAGQQDRRHLIAEPLLSGDLVGLARPLVKWSHEVRTLGELGTAVRRAFRLAAATPAGPVFLAIPMDVLEETGEALLPPRSRVDDTPTGGSLAELADMLAAAEWPGLVVGNELAWSDGLDAAISLAEALGAPVHGQPLNSLLVFPSTHPLWRGPLPLDAAGINTALAAYDRVLVLGADAFLVYPYTPSQPVPDGVELLQIHPDPAQLGRTHAVRLGVVGDPARCAAELAGLLRDRVPAERRQRVLAESDAWRGEVVARLAARVMEGRESRPLGPAAAVQAVVSGLPPDAVLVDEAITASLFVRALYQASTPTSYLWSGAGALGWGVPAALGAKLAAPERPVVCVVGDGSLMYAPQALWTAARYGLDMLTVVLDNREYRILKHGLDRLEGASARSCRYVGMDLGEPGIDLVALAGSLGVAGRSVEDADELEQAVREALASGEPRLLHVPVAGHRPGEESLFSAGRDAQADG
jgi:benzoylformate decarboxylase